eukprot:3145105-Prymnesium_polylepis.1
MRPGRPQPRCPRSQRAPAPSARAALPRQTTATGRRHGWLTRFEGRGCLAGRKPAAAASPGWCQRRPPTSIAHQARCCWQSAQPPRPLVWLLCHRCLRLSSTGHAAAAPSRMRSCARGGWTH